MSKTLYHSSAYSRMLDGSGNSISSTGGALDVSFGTDVTSATHDNFNVNANLQINNADLAFGETIMSSSLPVVLSSDHSTINVSDSIAQVDLSTIAGAVSGSEMQVDLVGSLPAGSNNIGDVDIASALPAGDNNIGNVDIVTLPVVGSHNNCAPPSTLTGSDSWDYSTAVDCQYQTKISAFGSVNPDTTITIKFQQSQDNTNFYDTGVTWFSVETTAHDFYLSLDNAGARYYRLGYKEADASPTLTNGVGTIAGKP